MNENLLLVGNGSSVLKQKNGRLIDNFGTVVRFNSYKTANFEDYVGIKTDIWFTVNCAHINNVHSYKEVLVHSWQWDKNKDKVFKKLSALRNCKKTDRKFVKTRFPFITPSTGLIAIYYFLDFYDCVYITGFDWWDTKPKDHHYGDKEPRGKLHKPEEEYKIIKHLEKMGYLKFLNDNIKK